MTRDERAVDALDASESAFGESAHGVRTKDAPAEKNPKKETSASSLRETESGSKPTEPLGSKPTPVSSSSSSENVFSIMAKKIKALELNQSMFDRYVEASIARVAERLDDVSADVEAAEEIAANATAASLRAEAKANAAAKDTSQLEEESKTARVVLEKSKRARTRSNTSWRRSNARCHE